MSIFSNLDYKKFIVNARFFFVFIFSVLFFLFVLSCKKQNKKTKNTSPTPIFVGSFAQTIPEYALDYVFENSHQISLKIDSIKVEIPQDFSISDGTYQVLHLRTTDVPDVGSWSMAESATLKLHQQKGFLYFHSDNRFNNFETLSPDLYRIYLLIISSKLASYIVPFVEIHKKTEFAKPNHEQYGFTAQPEKKIYSWLSDDLNQIQIFYQRHISIPQIDAQKHYFLIQRLILDDQQVINLPVQKISGIELQTNIWQTTLSLKDFFYIKIRLQSYLVQENPSHPNFNSTISISDCEFEIR